MSTTPDRSPGRYADYDRDIDIGRYLFAIWRRALPIAGVALVCAIIGFVVSNATPLTYESTTQLVVNRSKIGDSSTYQPPQLPINIPSYQAMVNNQSVAAEVIKECGLDKPPYNLTVAGFLGGPLTTKIVPETNVITITARLPEPKLAARVANAFADRAIRLPDALNQDDVASARGTLKAEVDEAERKLNQAKTTLETFRKTVQPDLVQSDVTRLLNQRGELATLVMDIEAEKARLKSAEEELAKQPATNTSRTLLDVPGSLARLRDEDAARAKREPAPAAVPPGAPAPKPQADTEPEAAGVRSDAVSPYANPVYEVLRQQVALSRTRLAALERRRAEMIGGKLDGPQLARLSELYTRQLELDRLETEYELAKEAYTQASTRYNDAQLQQSALTIRLQRLDTAYPPDGPMPRHRARNAIIGGAAGFTLSIVVVILLEMIVALGTSRPSKPAGIAG